MRRLKTTAELAEAIRSWHVNRNAQLFVFDDTTLSQLLFFSLHAGSTKDDGVMYGSIDYGCQGGTPFAFLFVPKHIDVDVFFKEAVEVGLLKQTGAPEPHHDMLLMVDNDNEIAAKYLLAEAISGYDGASRE